MIYPTAHVLLVCLLAATSLAREGDVLSKTSFLLSTQDWTLSGSGWSSSGLQRDRDRLFAEDDRSNSGKLWYFSAPKSFLGGDKSLAYNGWLTFELGHYEYESMMQPTISDYDVVLSCKNKKQNIGLKGVFIDDGATAHTYNVRLEESFHPVNSTSTWVKMSNGKQVSQRDFVLCLQNIQGINIRGSFFRGYEAVWLKDVRLIEGQIAKEGGQTWTEAAQINTGDASFTIVNGQKVYQPRVAPSPSSSCCSSRTCVSNDKYEILFDRPGCAISSDPLCDSSAISNSRVPNIIQALDVTNGRTFVINQANVGFRGTPLVKPFRQPFYFNSVPRICSVATLTVSADGDLANEADNIVVYGEDGAYLGTLFAGNLTYETGDAWYEQASETTPYIDSFAISQTKMMQYAADGQIRFLFASERQRDAPNVFSGTNAASSVPCDTGMCSVVGKVLIRWIKITFSAASCYTAKYASDKSYSFDPAVMQSQPINISLSFATPIGDASSSAGDAVLTVVTDSQIFDTSAKIEAWSVYPNGSLHTKLADLFSSEEFVGKNKDLATLGTTLGTKWINTNSNPTLQRFYADTAVISRDSLLQVINNGAASIRLYSTLPDNTIAFSGHFSPIFFSYPLQYCFMHSIKKGPYMNVLLERPQSLQFHEPGFPKAGGDVTFFIAAQWSGHQRYTDSGNLPELPSDRYDQFQTVSDMSKVAKHRQWPHGYNYMQLHAGSDGEWLADMFLKDYTQYSTSGYFIDTVTIPKAKFNSLVGLHPNNVKGEFSFSIWLPPGSGIIMLRSIVVGYPVASSADASIFDDSSISTSFTSEMFPMPAS